MKQGKNPNRKQKKIISDAKLNPDNWLVTKNLCSTLEIVHRQSGKKREIKVS